MIVITRRIVDKKLLAEVRQHPCCVAGCLNKAQAAHIKSKGAGGSDIPENLVPLCESHHEFEQHIIGWKRFREKHPEVTNYAELKRRAT